MKILISSSGDFMNGSLKSLEKYGNDVIVVDSEDTLSVALSQKIMDNEDVIVITDDSSDSLKMLQSVKKKEKFKIHIISCIPFFHEGDKKINRFKDEIDMWDGVISKAIYDMDEILKLLSREVSMTQAFDLARGYIGEILDITVAQLTEMKANERYVFSHERKRYEVS